jgi:hypothetical protein
MPNTYSAKNRVMNGCELCGGQVPRDTSLKRYITIKGGNYTYIRTYVRTYIHTYSDWNEGQFQCMPSSSRKSYINLIFKI